MARATMSDLITKLRGYSNAGTADYTIGGVAYWSDDQLQERLDKTRQVANYEPMEAIPTYGVGGITTYTEYRTGKANWENLPTIQDEGGTAIGTANYTFDANIGIVTFTADTEGKTRRITGNIYDVDRAAADVWRAKAAYVADSFDWSSDNHSIKRSQQYEHYLNMAKFYESQAGVVSLDVLRGDEL